MTPKQERFAYEYLLDFNATRAAIRAGYSEQTAYSQGQRLLKKVEVAAAIREGQRQAATKAECSLVDHLAQLAKIRDLAIGDGALSAAATAEHHRGKVAGHYIERVEHGEPGAFDGLTDDELDDAIDRLAAEAGVGAGASRKGSPTTH